MRLNGILVLDLLKPNSSESLNKKPWESPKLEAQIEEDEVIEFHAKVTKDDDSSNYTNSPTLPKKEEKESMLSKLKKIRKEKFNLHSQERIIIGGETEVKVASNNRISNEILQKFSTYNMQLAIVGDFENLQSKSLRDFIYESNKTGRILFVKTFEEALSMFDKFRD